MPLPGKRWRHVARPKIGRAIHDWLSGGDHRILAIAVGKVHAHVVVELPNYMPKIREIVGHAKRKSSRAVKDVLPGSIWGEGGKYKLVSSKSHLKNAVEYVLYEQGHDAWTWSFRDQSNVGRFGRRRPPGPKRDTSRGRAKRRPGSR
jgi:REP element-mobilizing transposase RayT